MLEIQKVEPTVLNFKKVNIKVSEGLVKEGGIFSGNYVTYIVCTNPLNF